MIMVIMDSQVKSQSIFNLLTPDLATGNCWNFLEDFPFDFYVVVKEMEQLPYLLGDVIKQWILTKY